MINHPRASTMGKTIIPIQSDKIGKDGIQMILETLARVVGTIPLGGSGGMNPNNRYTMKMDSRFHHLGRFSLAASHKAAVAERFVQHPRDDPFDFVALLLQAVPTGFQNVFAGPDRLKG